MRQLPPALVQYVEMVPVRMRFVYTIALVAFVGLVIGGFYFARGENAPLFATPLDAQQLAEVESQLQIDQIPFQATADNVLVPSSKKGDEMLRLVTEGVPHRHLETSEEMYKSLNAMTPTSVLAAESREGLQNDIARNLRGMSGVMDASVIVAQAQDNGYLDEASHPASASVTLKLDAGTTLPAQSVSGMQSLVARSVPGLDPEHVGIHDQTGADLTKTTVAQSGDTDRVLEARLNATLDTIFGPHMAFATVNVETQGSASTSHEIKHVPLSDRAIATDAEREHYVGKNKSYDKVRQNTDRGSDTIETNTQTAAGAIRRKTVAVFVNARISPLPSISQLTTLFGAAAGIDLSRGDSITVQAINLAAAPVPGAAAGAAGAAGAGGAPIPNPAGSALPQATLATFAGIPLPILMLLLASVVAVSYLGWLYIPQGLGQTANVAATKIAADEFEPVRVHAALRDDPPHTAAAILATLPSPTATAVLELYGADQRREIVKRLTKQISPIVRDVSVQAGRG